MLGDRSDQVRVALGALGLPSVRPVVQHERDGLDVLVGLAGRLGLPGAGLAGVPDRHQAVLQVLLGRELRSGGVEELVLGRGGAGLIGHVLDRLRVRARGCVVRGRSVSRQSTVSVAAPSCPSLRTVTAEPSILGDLVSRPTQHRSGYCIRNARCVTACCRSCAWTDSNRRPPPELPG